MADWLAPNMDMAVEAGVAAVCPLLPGIARPFHAAGQS